MNREHPEAVLFHLDDNRLLGKRGLHVVLALALYKEESCPSVRPTSVKLGGRLSPISSERVPTAITLSLSHRRPTLALRHRQNTAGIQCT